MKIKITILVLLLCCACEKELQKPFSTGMENKQLIDFNMQLPDGVSYFNTAKLAVGKETILFYYSPTCPYCRAQMREMLNYMDHLNNFQICVITDADVSSTKNFINYFKLQKYKNIITGIDTGFAIARVYRVRSVPFTAIFNKNKRLTSAYVGRLSGRNLLKVANL